MNTKMLGAALVISVVMLGFSLYAQVTRPFHPGPVWEIQFIRVKPGMDNPASRCVMRPPLDCL
jgi:hypothetical protein